MFQALALRQSEDLAGHFVAFLTMDPLEHALGHVKWESHQICIFFV